MDARAIGAMLGCGPARWGITVKSDEEVLLWDMHSSAPPDTSVNDCLQRHGPVVRTTMHAWRQIADDVTRRHWLEVEQQTAADRVPGMTVNWHAALRPQQGVPGALVWHGGRTELAVEKDGEVVRVPVDDRYAVTVPDGWTAHAGASGWVTQEEDVKLDVKQ